jgi:predicted RNase H-like nuclease
MPVVSQTNLMTVVLGIDAAWTASEPSGVALVVTQNGTPSCLAVAPSYAEFSAQAAGGKTVWYAVGFAGCVPDIAHVLAEARSMAGQPVGLVAIDMPVSKQSFRSRRAADDCVSKEFGSRWCSAHTPGAERPGQLGADLTAAFLQHGYGVRAVGEEWSGALSLIEVYPHTALLSLLSRSKRVPYKVSKSSKYWPGKTAAERISLLLQQYREILDAIEQRLGKVPLELPPEGTVGNLSRLKPYEDALDALVSAWMGLEYLAGRATALGDVHAAVWCPTDVVLNRDAYAG